MTTDERITDLEKHLHLLQETQARLIRQLAAARIDQWQARIDDLELQVHLGAMDGNERLAQRTEQLRNAWDRTRFQVESASSTAASAAETLWTGLEAAYRDVREVLLDPANKVSR